MKIVKEVLALFIGLILITCLFSFKKSGNDISVFKFYIDGKKIKLNAKSFLIIAGRTDTLSFCVNKNDLLKRNTNGVIKDSIVDVLFKYQKYCLYFKDIKTQRILNSETSVALEIRIYEKSINEDILKGLDVMEGKEIDYIYSISFLPDKHFRSSSIYRIRYKH